MLRESLRIIRQNYGYYIGFLAILCGTPWIGTYLGKSTTSLSVPTFFIWSLIALLVQCAVLYGQDFQELSRRADNPLRRAPGFLLRSFAICIFTTIATAAVFIGFSVKLTENIFGGFVLLGLFFYGLLLTLVGTWLPASVYGHKTSIADAFRRGRKHIFPILWRMMVALPVASAISFVVILATVIITALFGGQLPSEHDPAGTLSAPIVFGTLVATAVHIWSATYISIVVTRYYMVSEDITPAAYSGSSAASRSSTTPSLT